MPKKSTALEHTVKVLADTLVQMRAHSHLTQAQVAERMETTQTAISRLESGQQNPTIQTLRNYARANGFCLEIGFIRASLQPSGTGCVMVLQDFAPDESSLSSPREPPS